MKGKLIVIEGTDSVGKRTQALALAAALKKARKRAKLINFPTYNSEPGKLIKKYLHGKLLLSPHAVAILYALDRYQYASQITQLLKNGTCVICNRYSQSNLYQAAKLSNPNERRKFILWSEAVESNLPQADVVVFLNLPIAVSTRLLKKRRRKIDRHERDASYQEKVRKLYLAEARMHSWIVINCNENGEIKNKSAISAEMLRRLKSSAIFR